MRLEGHVARMRHPYNILVGKAHVKRLLGRSVCRWVGFKEMGRDGAAWIHLTQRTVHGGVMWTR
jgi:hypothetical protein